MNEKEDRKEEGGRKEGRTHARTNERTDGRMKNESLFFKLQKNGVKRRLMDQTGIFFK